MSSNNRAAPDIRIEQYWDRAIISGLDIDPFKLALRDAATVRTTVTRFALKAEKARKDQLPGTKDEAQQFLSFAKQVAYRCFEECIRNKYDTLAGVLEVIKRVMAKATTRGAPLLVEIIDYSGEYLPWEWLGDRNRASDHMGEARTTLGFCGVVCRRVVHDEDEEGRNWADAGHLEAGPKLPLRFFRNPELAGTRLDLRYFRFHEYVKLVGPLPEESPGGRLTLAEDLVDPSRSLSEIPLNCPDQVVHISCHHEVKGNQKAATAYELLLSESVLSFGKEDDQDREITVADLGYELSAAENRREINVRRPLVFLSACRGDFHPFTTNSVADVILRNGNRGIISTSVKIPDNSATELTKFFYDRLLDGDCSAAEALLFAKWSLLKHRLSPLGLLYSYYGSPDLRAVPVRNGHAVDPLIKLWSVG